MEVDKEKKGEEPFVKIGMIWSEAGDNLEKIPIKEEVVSDGESKSKFPTADEENSDQEQESSTCKTSDRDKNSDSDIARSYALLWQSKRNAKGKNKKSGDDSEIGNSGKSWCSHSVKNFKLVKKRLRCSDCRSLVCPECCKVTFSNLQNHLSGSDPHSFGFYSCKSCPLAFHSLCALQAHIRVHTLESPHVCPDCGEIYNNIYFLILHLINKCYHVYKIVRYKCKICNDALFSPSAFMDHIKELHISQMIRCSYCSLLFNNNDEFDDHLDFLHHKQKIQRLKHYCCLLCSDMLIPEFMYQKHIDQHSENPESYEIDYQCCCGKICRLIGPFRSHITYCVKKGILPPYWGFLQKNLRPQSLASMENFQDEQDPLAPNENSNSNFQSEDTRDENVIEDEFGGSNSLLSVEVRKNFNELHQEKSDKPYGGSIAAGKKSTIAVKLSSDSSHPKDSDSVHANQSKPNRMDVQEVELLTSRSKETENKCSVEDSDSNVGKSSGFDGEKMVRSSDGSHGRIKEKGGIHVDTETSKIVYDHIPCDHLGYLRIQCSDLNKKESVVGEIKFGEELMGSSSQNDFHIVTELDEKTGLITSRKVAIETIDDDETDYKDDNSEDSSTSNNLYREMFNGDRVKMKLGTNAYFMCPFCIVLFPKGISAFQQFRLHIECYHSDSAINITVNQGENEKVETNRRTIKDVEKHELQKPDVENKINSAESSNNKEQLLSKSGCFKVVSTKTFLKNSLEGDKKAEDILDDSNGGNRLENNNDDSVTQDEGVLQEVTNDQDVKKDEKLSNEEGNEKTTGELERSFAKVGQTIEKDLYWSVKLSVQSNSSTSHDNTSTTLTADERSKTDDSILGIVYKSNNKEVGSRDSDSVGKKEERLSCEASKPAHAKDERDDRDIAAKEKQRLLIASQSRNCVVILEKKDAEEYTNSLIAKNRDATNEQMGKSQSGKTTLFKDDKQNSNKTKRLDCSIEGVPSDYEEEYDNSKDSNWSAESSFEFLGESKTLDFPEGTSMRTRSSEKSKRESEVWSEFYESLKIAEKLKKSKKRKSSSSCHFENKRKSVVLPEYSAKRIVKKPKRYGQSSDSQDSIGEYEFSESENEGAFTDNLVVEAHSQEREEAEKDSTDMRIQKKQRLLNKIERIDPKVVDYLFELLKRKEKCYELFKKHSNLRSSRYSQDLRRYRKNVLKGIKNRGRPYKVLRYQEIVKKRGSDEGGSDINETLEEITGQGTRSKTPSPTDSKSGEKKRGRPRKLGKSGKLKERRRSDKEVDFIEKNFETEESGASLNKRKRKLSSKLQYYKKTHISEEKDEFSSGQVITNKSGDSNRKFSCAVCKDIFPDSKVFREHIVIHRMEEGTYQCMECGECFVVRPSLEKHLHAFHKIKNTDKYITENDCWNIRKDGAEAENEPLKENQCKVCKDQFDRAIDLTKHFRIHGMAFLKEFKKESKAK